MTQEEKEVDEEELQHKNEEEKKKMADLWEELNMFASPRKPAQQTHSPAQPKTTDTPSTTSPAAFRPTISATPPPRAEALSSSPKQTIELSPPKPKIQIEAVQPIGEQVVYV